MTETFFSLLEKRVQDSSSLICIALDPNIGNLPYATNASVLDFCLNLVHQTAAYTAAFKINPSSFDIFGGEGWSIIKQIIEAIRQESIGIGSVIPVILDAKHNDVGKNVEAYARSAFDQLGIHCITLNPYLGRDSIDPFIQDPGKGVFLLCKTSNAGSMDLQNLLILPVGSDSPMPLYTYVAQLAQKWNMNNNVGIIVGAAHPQIMSNIRAAAPDLWFLSSGMDTQSVELDIALKAGLRADGSGMLIDVSAGIFHAVDNPVKAVKDLRDNILKIAVV